jgi:hypothetical protein
MLALCCLYCQWLCCCSSSGLTRAHAGPGAQSWIIDQARRDNAVRASLEGRVRGIIIERREHAAAVRARRQVALSPVRSSAPPPSSRHSATAVAAAPRPPGAREAAIAARDRARLRAGAWLILVSIAARTGAAARNAERARRLRGHFGSIMRAVTRMQRWHRAAGLRRRAHALVHLRMPLRVLVWRCVRAGVLRQQQQQRI